MDLDLFDWHWAFAKRLEKCKQVSSVDTVPVELLNCDALANSLFTVNYWLVMVLRFEGPNSTDSIRVAGTVNVFIEFITLPRLLIWVLAAFHFFGVLFLLWFVFVFLLGFLSIAVLFIRAALAWPVELAIWVVELLACLLWAAPTSLDLR